MKKWLLFILFVLIAGVAYSAEYLEPLYFEHETGCWVYADAQHPKCEPPLDAADKHRDEYWEYEFSIPEAVGLKKIGSDYGWRWLEVSSCESWNNDKPSNALTINGYNEPWSNLPDTVLNYDGENILKLRKAWGGTWLTPLAESKGLKTLKICLYYPLLEIKTTSQVPSQVKADDEIKVEGVVKNIGDVDAKNVVVKIETTDFDVSPSQFTVDVLHKDAGESDSQKKFSFILKPKKGTDKEINYELNGINFGKVVVSYTFDGVTKKFEKEIGKASYAKKTENTAPANTPSQESPQTNPPSSENNNKQTNQQKGGLCGPSLLLPLVLLLALSLKVAERKEN